MNIGIIVAIIIILAILAILALIIWACIVNKCIVCGEPAVMCKSCKHYNPPLVTSNYEPKEEDEMTEVDFLAKRINALDDDEFRELCKLVESRGYEDGRN